MASMTMPSLATVRARSRGNSCVSNLNQLGLASLMYAQDYDDRFPPARYRVGGQTYSILHFLAPYAQRSEYWRCPSDPFPATRDDFLWIARRHGDPSYPPLAIESVSYGVNHAIVAPTGRPPYLLDELARPPDTALWYDALLATDGQSITWLASPRHGGFCNVGYCDGSVRPMHCTADTADSALVTVRYARTRTGESSYLPLWRVDRGPYAGQSELNGVIERDGKPLSAARAPAAPSHH